MRVHPDPDDDGFIFGLDFQNILSHENNFIWKTLKILKKSERFISLYDFF